MFTDQVKSSKLLFSVIIGILLTSLIGIPEAGIGGKLSVRLPDRYEFRCLYIR